VSHRSPEEMKIILRLCEEDQEFKQLWQRHQEFDRRVSALEEMHHLTPEEEVELKQIKKLKLLGKDKIEARIRSSKAATAA